MIRFSEGNWARFESHGKKTTIRTKELKSGVHEAGHGSHQWGNWVSYSDKVRVHPYSKSCTVLELDEADACSDGFDSLCELLLELGRLNKGITPETVVWVHPVEKIKI